MSLEAHVQSLGDQLAASPLLAVMYPGNKIVLLHNLLCFVVPSGQQHKYKGEMVTFLNESKNDKSPSLVVKLNNEDFQEAKVWLYLNLVMDANHKSCLSQNITILMLS